MLLYHVAPAGYAVDVPRNTKATEVIGYLKTKLPTQIVQDYDVEYVFSASQNGERSLVLGDGYVKTITSEYINSDATLADVRDLVR